MKTKARPAAAPRGSASPIDAYLAGLPGDQRAALERTRAAILAAAPGAEECISYNMPAFRVAGKLVAGFSASRQHCSYFPMSGATVATLAGDLRGYDTSKGTIRFAADRPLPATLVRKLVRTRLAEIAAEGAAVPPRVRSGSPREASTARPGCRSRRS